MADPGDNLALLKRYAKSAREARVGNCEIQSALAFDWIASNVPSRPMLEWMYLNPWVEEGVCDAEVDHAFVVVGRTSGKMSDPTTWNSETAICDPWAKRAYLVSEFAREMESIESVTKGVTKTVLKHALKAGAEYGLE